MDILGYRAFGVDVLIDILTPQAILSGALCEPFVQRLVDVIAPLVPYTSLTAAQSSARLFAWQQRRRKLGGKFPQAGSIKGIAILCDKALLKCINAERLPQDRQSGSHSPDSPIAPILVVQFPRLSNTSTAP